MIYRAIYETSTGRLISIGSTWSDPLPAEYSFNEYADKPDLTAQMWDETAREFVPRPQRVLVDRLEDIRVDADFKDFWGSLNPAQQTRIRNFFMRFLGKVRYRNPQAPANTLDWER